MAISQEIIRVSYFWHTLFYDWITAIKPCTNFQIYATKTTTPPTPLHPIIAISPFYKWGIHFMECDWGNTPTYHLWVIDQKRIQVVSQSTNKKNESK